MPFAFGNRFLAHSHWIQAHTSFARSATCFLSYAHQLLSRAIRFSVFRRVARDSPRAGPIWYRPETVELFQPLRRSSAPQCAGTVPPLRRVAASRQCRSSCRAPVAAGHPCCGALPQRSGRKRLRPPPSAPRTSKIAKLFCFRNVTSRARAHTLVGVSAPPKSAVPCLFHNAAPSPRPPARFVRPAPRISGLRPAAGFYAFWGIGARCRMGHTEGHIGETGRQPQEKRPFRTDMSCRHSVLPSRFLGTGTIYK